MYAAHTVMPRTIQITATKVTPSPPCSFINGSCRRICYRLQQQPLNGDERTQTSRNVHGRTSGRKSRPPDSSRFKKSMRFFARTTCNNFAKTNYTHTKQRTARFGNLETGHNMRLAPRPLSTVPCWRSRRRAVMAVNAPLLGHSGCQSTASGIHEPQQ